MKISTFNRLTSLLVLVVLLVSGCTKSPDENQTDGQVAIQVGAGISTRAVGTLWNDNDAIGITMFDQGTYNLADGSFVNCQYVVPSGVTGAFSPINNSSTIYFPKSGSAVDLMAYYPYSNQMAANYVMPLNVSNQSVLPQIDFMTAQHVSGNSKSTPNAQLLFYHRLSNIIINLQDLSGNSSSRLQGSQITVKGMYTQGSYSLINNSTNAVSNLSNMADFNIVTDPSGVTAQGIVFPRSASAGVIFEITLTDGSIYHAYMDPTLELKSGYQYTFYITLNKTPIEVSAAIQPWTTGTASNLTAIAMTTTANPSVNVNVGDVMRVYSASSLLATYTYGSNSLWSTTSAFYWENLVGQSVAFTASIHPTPELNSTQLPDYIMADPITVARDQSINFILRHKTSKVTVKLTSVDGTFSSSELSGASVTLPGYKGGGVDMNGVFQPGSTTQDILLQGFVALFQPQTITAGSNLAVVTINGKNYYVTTPVNVVYAPGEARLITIDMSKVKISMGATVVDWVTGNPIGLTTKYLTVATPGATNGFLAGNTIGLSVLNNGNLSSSFTYQSGAWTANAPVIYWDDLTTVPLEIAATFPSGLTPSLPNKTVHWSIYSDQQVVGNTPSDLLVAYLPSLALGQAANLNFQHAMNKVVITLIPGVGFTTGSLSGASVVLTNMITQCDVNLTNLAVTSPITGSITPYNTSGFNFSAIVGPRVIPANTPFLTVTIGADTYPVSSTSSITLGATQITTINVTINKTPIGISGNVESWTSGFNGSFIIN